MSGESAQLAEPPSRARDSGSAAPGFFHESFTQEGSVRAHWDGLLGSLDGLGLEALTARAENARRLLHEQGVSCFVHGDGAGRDEPWQLDLIPLVIDAGEWGEIELGLLQRARLLNLVLADLYGTQRLVRDGFVPAPLVFANPAYLRPCQGMTVRDETYLMTYSADLARSPDGRWWVISDRTQASTGFGFSMQNRSVMSRVMPELMRELQPRPVLDCLRLRREALRRLSPGHQDNPSIALLTPGPRNESYFEHAYLSRLLGLTLVEGDDLTVRDRRLWVKTLSGLRPVDVVLRRVTDSFCDPLELRSDSLLGVPGLLEVARAGNVAIGNAIGTGLLESPAFMPFLPGLCRHLLDEDLRLPSPATWWCGQGREQGYVQEHLGELSLRPAFNALAPLIRPASLEPEAEAALRENLRLRPHEYVGQEPLQLSRALLWTGQELASRPFVFRVFVIHTGSDYLVMPGGLAHVVDVEHGEPAMVRLSGVNKDVWVLPGDSMPATQPHTVTAPIPQIERAPSDVPSRTADNLFWLGRYTERLEQAVRTARYAVSCVGDVNERFSQPRLAPLQEILKRLSLLAEEAVERSREALQQELLTMLYEPGRAGGMQDLLERIHLAAFCVRDRLSTDTWHLLNRLKTRLVQGPGALPLVDASTALHALVLDLAAFSGMEMENMTRGHGWIFLDLGRRIERGLFIARLMEVMCGASPGMELMVEPALEIADSVMTHRRRYFSEPRLATVMEVLIQDASNPRSLTFQVTSIGGHAALLPTGQNPEGVQALRELVASIVAAVKNIHVDPPGEGARTPAEELHGVACALSGFSELLTEVYFSHVLPRSS